MHIIVMENKKGESSPRSGSEVNATTIRRIRPRGAEWPMTASARPLNFSPPKPCSYERKAPPLLPRHVNRKFFNKKWTKKISPSLAWYRLVKIINSIFIELFLEEVFCKCC